MSEFKTKYFTQVPHPVPEALITSDNAIKLASELYGLDTMAATVFIDKYMPKESGYYDKRTISDFFKILAKKIFDVDKEFKDGRKLSEKRILELINGFNKFVLGGSVMAGLIKYKYVSLGNCFVVGVAHDSYNGILETESQMVNILKRRGGVGTDLSHIRAKGSRIHNAAQRSTGIVPFAKRYSNAIQEVAQAEGRRGAGMLTLNITHPDILDFINAKTNQNELNGVNVSVKIDKREMEQIIDYASRDEKNKGKSKEDIAREIIDAGWVIQNVGVAGPGMDNGIIDQIFEERPRRRRDADVVADEAEHLEDDIVIKASENNYVNPYVVFKKIIENATKYAEPGILFWDKISEQIDSELYYDKELAPVSTNPCGELPLPPYDSCRLGSVNLYSYVLNPFTDNAEFDIKTFTKDVYDIHQIMDDVITLEEQRIDVILTKLLKERQQLMRESSKVQNVLDSEIMMWNKILETAKKGRRIGLGFMGLADMLAALNVKYDSPDGVVIATSVIKELATATYKSTIDLAESRQPFPSYSTIETHEKNKNKYISRIKETVGKEYVEKWTRYGRRNVQNLAVAPTGTISMMAGISSGLEPVFNLRYKRKRVATSTSKNVFKDAEGNSWEEFYVIHKPFVKWFKMNFPDKNESILYNIDNKQFDKIVEKSPYYKSTTHYIDPYNKIIMQGQIQQWIDASISVTHNMPKGTTSEEVMRLALFAYEQGVKGFTVYVDGSRIGILTNKDDKEPKEVNTHKRPISLKADIYTTMVHGEKWVVLIGLNNNKPYEVFAFKLNDKIINIKSGIIVKEKSKKYSLRDNDNNIIIKNIIEEFETPEEEFGTRLISTALRHGADIKFIYEQLSKSKGDITHFSKAISRILKKYVDKEDLTINETSCPNCGSKNLSMAEGCVSCRDCGWSKCN